MVRILGSGRALRNALVTSLLGFGICPVGNWKEGKETWVIYMATTSSGMPGGGGSSGPPSLLPTTLAFAETALRVSTF